MLYKNLGNTEIKIPAIAQGASRIGSYSNFNPDEVNNRIKAIRYGIDMGMNFIDNAELYGGGFAEEVVGRVIEGVREKVFLATKFNPRENVSESLRSSIENSLRRLKTDYIDLYQIHWPNPAISLEQTMLALSRLIEEGKVRFAGLSNFPVEDFIIAQSFFNCRLVSNQIEYNLLDRSAEDESLLYCRSQKVTLLAYSPLNQGIIFINDEQKRVLLSIAEKYGKTVPQVILRWLIKDPSVVVITRTKSIERVKANALSTEFELMEEDILKINELSKQNFIEVPVNSIRLNTSSDKAIYTSLSEAIENRLDLIPSPVNLAKVISARKIIMPVRVHMTKAAVRNHTYDMDDYDIMDQVKKYWAWIIAYGYDKPIPVFVLNSILH